MEDSEAEEAWLEAVQTAALRIGRLNHVRCPIPKAARRVHPSAVWPPRVTLNAGRLGDRISP